MREVVARFTTAFERGDVNAILALLSDDAKFGMPPYARWYEGREAIAGSWLMPGGPPPRLRYVPTSANGQAACGTYCLDPESGRYLPIALDVLALRACEITEVIAFRTPAVFARFGIPCALDEPQPYRRSGT